jgi:hypothetical protein
MPMRAAIVSMLLVLCGCGLSLDPRIDPERDAGRAMDAGEGDASARDDAATALDVGSTQDASEGSVRDARVLADARTDDTGWSDDAGSGDAGQSDDAGRSDDAGSGDAGWSVALDAWTHGSDAGPDGGDASLADLWDAGRDAWGVDRLDAGRDAGATAPDAASGVLGGPCVIGRPASCPDGFFCREFIDPFSVCPYFMCTVSCSEARECRMLLGTTAATCNADGVCERTGPGYGPVEC